MCTSWFAGFHTTSQVAISSIFKLSIGCSLATQNTNYSRKKDNPSPLALKHDYCWFGRVWGDTFNTTPHKSTQLWHGNDIFICLIQKKCMMNHLHPNQPKHQTLENSLNKFHENPPNDVTSTNESPPGPYLQVTYAQKRKLLELLKHRIATLEVRFFLSKKRQSKQMGGKCETRCYRFLNKVCFFWEDSGV